jgi:glycosyltransferase involved in cell wall biosynthesis
MTVAIIESDAGGHRLLYVRLAVVAAPGPVVLVTTRACVASAEYATHLSDLAASGRLTVVEVEGRRNSTQRAMRAAQDSAPGGDVTIVIPEADSWLPSLCRYALTHRRLPRLRALVMRTARPWPPTSRTGRRAIVKVVTARALGILWPKSAVLFLTDSFGVVNHRPGFGHARPLRDAPIGFPAHERSIARDQLDLPDDAFAIGILGDVSWRKRPDLTLAALPNLPPYVHAVFAGRQDEEAARAIKAALRSPLGARIHVLDRYLDDDQLGLVLSALDAVVLTHTFDAPSGILTGAVRAGVPAIVAGSQWLVRVVRELGFGVECELTPDGLATAVGSLLVAPDSYAGPLAGAASTLLSNDFGSRLLGLGDEHQRDARRRASAKVVMLEGIAFDYRTALYRELIGTLDADFVLGADTAPPTVTAAVRESGGRYETLPARRLGGTYTHPDGFSDQSSVVLYTRVYSLLRREHPSVIITTEMGIRTAQATLYKLLHPTVKLVVWARLSERSETGRSLPRVALRRTLARFPTTVIVNGASGARYCESIGVAADKIVVIPQVSAIPAASQKELDKRRPRREMRTVLYVGRLVSLKGVDLLIHAVAKTPHPLHLRIIGSGPELDRLKSLSSELAVSADFVDWIDDLVDLRREYLAADYFVLPSLADEWGLVVVEALSQGTPVLGSVYAQAAIELVKPGQNGFLFSPDDAQQFTAALTDAATLGPEEWRRASAAAARSVDEITPAQIAELFHAVIVGS